MSNPFGRPKDCPGTQASLPNQCQCPDPGLVALGQDVLVTDSSLCPRRLIPARDGNGNVINGFLALIGSGLNASVQWVSQPSVVLPPLAVASGQSFGALIISSGPTGTQYVVVPPSALGLYLVTAGAGNLKFAALPAGSVPDPLSIGTLNLTTALNLTGTAAAAFAGAISMTGLPAGTITNPVGLNVTNQLVKGSLSTISKGWYFEAATRTGTTYPNTALQTGGSCTIGNRLYDADGLASITNSTTLTLTVNGTYQIDWSGAFGTSAGGPNDPGISLVINGSIVNPGMRGLETTGAANYNTTPVVGRHIYAGNANDTISLQVVCPSLVGSDNSSTALNLRDVELVITKFK